MDLPSYTVYGKPWAFSRGPIYKIYDLYRKFTAHSLTQPNKFNVLYSGPLLSHRGSIFGVKPRQSEVEHPKKEIKEFSSPFIQHMYPGHALHIPPIPARIASLKLSDQSTKTLTRYTEVSMLFEPQYSEANAPPPTKIIVCSACSSHQHRQKDCPKIVVRFPRRICTEIFVSFLYVKLACVLFSHPFYALVKDERVSVGSTYLPVVASVSQVISGLKFGVIG
ncbi:hypothetical protein R3P38DRAFT_2793685 [Favolaschia claudopus]|uniref:Uncharacterized protein n=1 Tax=Favolaschia claudopus TaxID=2862362 RepID=A0AAW0ABD9_9AGAR